MDTTLQEMKILAGFRLWTRTKGALRPEAGKLVQQRQPRMCQQRDGRHEPGQCIGTNFGVTHS
jgi:hypothetical protein